jgi:predicted nucleic acid-binding protein
MEFQFLAIPSLIYIPICLMPRVVISDTSTLILFHKIEEFNLLQKVYKNLITTPEIAEEFGEKLTDWIKIQKKPLKSSI